jgi:hypothetical protein
VTSAKATDVLPGVASLAEVGVNDYEAELWYAVIARSSLPPTLAAKINAGQTGHWSRHGRRAAFDPTSDIGRPRQLLASCDIYQ